MKVKNYLKLISVLLTLILALSVFSGCKKKTPTEEKPQDTSDETEEDDGFEKDDLPKTMDFDTKKINMMICLGGYENFYQEKATPEAVSNQVFLATQRVEERLNVSLNFIKNSFTWDNRGSVYSKICNDIRMQVSECDIIAGHPYIPMYGGTELFTDLSTLKNVNLDKSWYDQGMRSVWGEKIYCIRAEGAIRNIQNLACTFFNQDALDRVGIDENLYDTVYNGEWTLEKMKTLIENTWVSNDAEVSADDSFGATFSDGNAFTPFGISLGVRLYERQDDGSYVYNASSERNITIMDAIKKFVNNNENVLSSYNRESEDYKITTEDGIGVSKIFAEGRSLFTFGCFGHAGVILDQDVISNKSLGILPYPKFDSTQTDYASAVNNVGVCFYIPTTASDLDCAGAVLEAWNSDFHRNAVPLYFETMLKIRYSSGGEMSAMFDFIRSKLTCTFEYMFEDPDIMTMGSGAIKSMISGQNGLTSWRVIAKSNENVANMELKNIMVKYGIISE